MKHFQACLIGLSSLALATSASAADQRDEKCRSWAEAVRSAQTDFSALNGLHLKLPASGLEGCSASTGRTVSAFLCNWTFPEAQQGAAMVATSVLVQCLTLSEWAPGVTETGPDELTWKLSPSFSAILRTPRLVAGRWLVDFRVISQNK